MILKCLLALVLFSWLVKPVGGCWTKKWEDSDYCDPTLTFQLTGIEEQYQSFLKAVASLDKVKVAKFKSEEFLDFESIFWKWSDLDALKPDTNTQIRTYTLLLERCVAMGLSGVYFSRNERWKVFTFMERNNISQLVIPVRATNSETIVFATNYRISHFGSGFKNFIATPTLRAQLKNIGYQKAKTDPSIEAVDVVADTFTSEQDFLGLLCLTQDEITKQFLRDSQTVQEFLLKHEQFEKEKDKFANLANLSAQMLIDNPQDNVCQGAFVELLNTYFLPISDQISFLSSTTERRHWLNNLKLLKVNLTNIMPQIDKACKLLEDNPSKWAFMKKYMKYVYEYMPVNFKFELSILFVIIIFSLSSFCCCGCQAIECVLQIICKLMKLLFVITCQCCLMPILHALEKCWEMCQSSFNSPTQNSETRPSILYSNLMRFQPIMDSPSRHTPPHRFIVPTLSQIDLSNRENSRFTEIT